jgi:uncharacterized protein (TIGR02996 family)
MNDEAAFRAALALRPDDESVRQVFADWLEERGDPRAEFLRLQLRLDHLAETDSAWGALCARERALMAAHWEQVRPLVVDRCELVRSTWGYRRFRLRGRCRAIVTLSGWRSRQWTIAVNGTAVARGMPWRDVGPTLGEAEANYLVMGFPLAGPHGTLQAQLRAVLTVKLLRMIGCELWLGTYPSTVQLYTEGMGFQMPSG